MSNLAYFAIAFIAGLLVRVLTPHGQEIADYAWAWAQGAVPLTLFFGAGYLAVWGFWLGMNRLAGGMRARDKVPPLPVRDGRARSSSRRAASAARARP